MNYFNKGEGRFNNKGSGRGFGGDGGRSGGGFGGRGRSGGGFGGRGNDRRGFGSENRQMYEATWTNLFTAIIALVKIKAKISNQKNLTDPKNNLNSSIKNLIRSLKSWK